MLKMAPGEIAHFRRLVATYCDAGGTEPTMSVRLLQEEIDKVLGWVEPLPIASIERAHGMAHLAALKNLFMRVIDAHNSGKARADSSA